MKAYNTSSYPVFEADQVLSQKDLNMAVSHLEEQDRITRKNLTGIGITCGLELAFPAKNQVKISCGTAVTSLGFQINWNEKLFTHYKETKLSDQFLAPDYTDEPYLDAIFKYSKSYASLKKIYDLLPSDASDTDKKPIPNDFFDDKLIILLLEVTLIDQKNCVTTNCDDKGKRLEFNLRPIAVSSGDWFKELFPQYPSYQFTKLTFPRYNVPYNTITTPAKVLDNFVKPFSAAYIKSVSDAVSKIYNEYKGITNQNLNVLNDAKTVIDKNLKAYKDTINVQYFWDWMSDIVSAYNELICSKKTELSLCCVNEALFPFHVVLGGSTAQSLTYRTPFFSTNNSSKKNEKKLKELQLLFEKLAHIISSFKIEKNLNIRITPSQYGDVKLSEKALPFYYDEILELRDYWSPHLTIKKLNDTVLSYHSLQNNYTTKAEVKAPLLFETEPYNFFRIEGHIGKNYQDAMADILRIQETHQLPFKVIALNATQFPDLPINLATDETNWSYLETDYDLVRRNWENVIGKIIEWLEDHQGTIKENRYIKDLNFLNNYIRFLKKGRNSMVESFTAFIKIYHQFIPIYEKIEELSIQFREAVYNKRNEDLRFEEDLIDHIDEVIMVCEKGEFRALYQAAQEKWKELGKRLSLQRFIEKHPGIEHKAGVTKGGTFIVVYKENPPKKKLQRIDAIRNLSAARNEKTLMASNEATSGVKASVDVSGTECSSMIENSLLKMQNYIAYYHPENALELNKYLFYYFNPKFVVENNDIIPDKTVIADFYIPYICCGEGDVINFVLGKVEEEPKVGDFDFPDFDSEDFNTNR
ncbi:hypothetical protein [Chryseobacterium oryctis]|uniref:Uncharacterized protein n=1 Tax=Chryseobacterium oryctis TaxID=2952618 RepID=A0ABT3HS47_9FLAO|nr:hypothetical protein [Chryseobacterium oryctis]MCW3162448.1 hypothetical protein [Chryseobacterium oryctis]